MNRKILNRRERLNGSAKQRVGTILGIHDKNGEPLRVGDRVMYRGFEGVILYSLSCEEYLFYYSYSKWYGDNIYDSRNYGKIAHIPMDDGARMELELIYDPV